MFVNQIYHMKYMLIKDIIDLLEQFDAQNLKGKSYDDDVEGFKRWLKKTSLHDGVTKEPDWEGKENGRSAESAINTLIVHMSRYAKSYSKSAIMGSGFSNQEDFIYLINLKAFGAMSKMELIRKNVHEKSVGMQIINRLVRRGWVDQTSSETDKRSKVICITPIGLRDLERQMHKIRQATKLVAGDLTYNEKMELIRLLNKLDNYHQVIYDKNIEPEDLLDMVVSAYKP